MNPFERKGKDTITVELTREQFVVVTNAVSILSDIKKQLQEILDHFDKQPEETSDQVCTSDKDTNIPLTENNEGLKPNEYRNNKSYSDC